MNHKNEPDSKSRNLDVEREAPLWDTLMRGVRSMLRNIDAVTVMPVEEAAALTPDAISRMGKGVRRLPLAAVRTWRREQIAALSTEQLVYLDAGPAQWIAERVGASKRRAWLLGCYQQSVFRTFPYVLASIQDAGTILALATLMESDVGPDSAKALFLVARYGKDWQLTTLLDAFSQETFKEIVLSDVPRETIPDPEHLELGLVHEQDTLLEKRDETRRQIARAQEAIKELDSYEHTLLHVKHPQVREKVMRDLREWLAGTLFAGSEDTLILPRELMRLSPLQQKSVLRSQLHDLKNQMQSKLDQYQAEADILWASFEDLIREWEMVAARQASHEETSTRIISKLEDLERDLEPYIEALKDSKKKAPSIGEVDRYMEEIRQGVEEAERIQTELDAIEQRLKQIQLGLDHDVTHRFLEQSRPSDPGEVQLFGLQVFKRMTTMAHTPEQLDKQKALRSRIKIICDQDLFQLLDDRTELYRNIYQTIEKVHGLKDRLIHTPGEVPDQPGIIDRCKQRILAWETLRQQIQKLIGD